MSSQSPTDAFGAALSAIDAGDLDALQHVLAEDPQVVTERMDYGEGYFRRPYLLWFVADNPVRNGVVPPNIAALAGAIITAAAHAEVASRREQLDYTLGLVCSGRVTRECGVQRELIDTLVDAGADPDPALLGALAHKETDAAERLIERGATMTLTAAVCTDRDADVARLARGAGEQERRIALAAAALYGQAQTLRLLHQLGVDVNGYGPPEFHPHATALHHAVDSGSLDAVTMLVEAGARLDVKDRVYHAVPHEWAAHLNQPEIADYLRRQR